MTEPDDPDEDTGALTADVVTQMVTSYEQGASILALVEHYGLTYRAVRTALLREGVVLRSAGRRETPPSPAGLVEAYLRGDTIRVVAKNFGLSFGMVRRMLLGSGVQLREPGRRS